MKIIILYLKLKIDKKIESVEQDNFKINEVLA